MNPSAGPNGASAAHPLGGTAFVALVVVVSTLALPMFLFHDARAANYPALTGTVHGPQTVGTGIKYTYRVTATGGPAVGFNGTQIGVLSFSTNLIGLNSSVATLLPTAGVFVNGSTNLTLTTGNLTQTLTLSIELKSGYGGQNITTNITYVVQVIQPYVVSAQIIVESNQGTIPFNLSVYLDGNFVGTIVVPALTSHATYQATYSYVNPGLGAGWHTFSLSLTNEHGLVAFSGGATLYTQSFYVSGAPENDTIWYIAGGSALVAAVFIWLTAVGARRRTRKR
ncbi:MAG TPA: hypothetical protein VGV89_02400 [Thermoplasmata archaeon]|nr:hypothetical protein [Thermoplasmata archaeon]